MILDHARDGMPGPNSRSTRPGLTMTVAGLASLPVNWWSDIITKKCGLVNVLIVAFFGYAVRYIGYSLIKLV